MKSLRHTILAAVAYAKGLPAKRLWNCLLVVAAFAGLAGLVALTDPPKSGAAGEPAKPVIVKNTPLPVSGTVGISGTPNVNVKNTPLPVSGTVGISGTPNVNVSNMPTVGIDSMNNTVRIARDAENPARQPFRASPPPVPLNVGVVGRSATLTIVPAGKRLVIEYVSVQGDVPAGQSLICRVLTGPRFAFTQDKVYILRMTDQGKFGSREEFATSELVRIYAEPGEIVNADAIRSDGSETGSAVFTISGYLVDVP